MDGFFMEENHGNSYQVPDQGIPIYGLNKRERREKALTG